VHIRYHALLIIATVAVGLPQDKNSSADRSIAGPSAQQPSAPPENGLLDKILVMVGPAEPTPLTKKQAFEAYLLSTGGPVPILGEAGGAAFGQWMNTPEEYGQGWDAYGKRFGANLAYNATRQTISYGTSLVFHEDTRYFASHSQRIWPRARHALVSTFTARHPDGSDRFSVSSVAGVVGACTISSIWGPPSWKGPGNIAYNAGISFASTAGFNIVREFLPDLFRRPRKQAQMARSPLY
jgi:hypothetical protein